MKKISLALLLSFVLLLGGCPENPPPPEEELPDINGPQPAKQFGVETSDASIRFHWLLPTKDDSIYNRDIRGFLIVKNEGTASTLQPERGEILEIGDALGTQSVVAVIPAEATKNLEIPLEWMDSDVGRGATYFYQVFTYDEVPNYSDPMRVQATPGSIITPRLAQAQLLLSDGRVLLTGGIGSEGPLDTAEIFDSTSGLFHLAAGTMHKPRFSHTVTLLQDGRVLLVGGYEEGLAATLDSAEVFDPSGETFTYTGTRMAFGRALHTAERLEDGRVLIVGGTDGVNAFDTAEIFDPATETFTLVEDTMTYGRMSHTMTPVHDFYGNPVYLITGGLDIAGTMETATFFDLASLDFRRYFPVPDEEEQAMNVGRMSHTATKLADGRAYFIGGFSGTKVSGAPTSSIERFDPDTGEFTQEAFIGTARSGHQTVTLSDGRLLVLGGIGKDLNILDSCEVYDPATRQVSSAPPLNVPRTVAQITRLPDGSFFLAGGNASNNYFLPEPISTVEVLPAAGGEWRLFPQP